MTTSIIDHIPGSTIFDVSEALKFDTITFALVATVFVLTVNFLARKWLQSSTSYGKAQLPPHIPSNIPFVGHAISFNKSPLDFLSAAYQKYGPVFSFTMVGKTYTYLVGSDAAESFFRALNKQLDIAEAYNQFTVPMFGKRVAYDAPHNIFYEQKKMLRLVMTTDHFRKYVLLIEQETLKYCKDWGNAGKIDLNEIFSRLVLDFTAKCIIGKEIYNTTNDTIQLYRDLKLGCNGEAYILPSWLPLPSFRKRDRAHKKLREIYLNAVKTRKESGIKDDDYIQMLLDANYKDGKEVVEDEVARTLLAFLLAAHLTTSNSMTWLGCFLAKHKDIQKACFEEQIKAFGKESIEMEFDGLEKCFLLDRCLKESLRLRPTQHSMIRVCKMPLNVLEFTIPPGHVVGVSSAINHKLPNFWTNPSEFTPDRFADINSTGNNGKFNYVPFGGGRHLCGGASFASLAIRTVWSVLLRRFEFDLVDGVFPTPDNGTISLNPSGAVLAYRRRNREENNIQ